MRERVQAIENPTPLLLLMFSHLFLREDLLINSRRLSEESRRSLRALLLRRYRLLDPVELPRNFLRRGVDGGGRLRLFDGGEEVFGTLLGVGALVGFLHILNLFRGKAGGQGEAAKED